VITVEARPVPPRDDLRDAVAAFAEIRRLPVRPHDLRVRDPDFIERAMPLLDLFYDHYFRAVTEFEEELPEEPILAVANHNGMSGTPDMFCLMTAYWRHFGTAAPAFGLMHDFPFRAPWAGSWLNRCGALAASPHNAYAALAQGAKVLVFPGGDIDACKPTRDRYRIVFSGRRGFVRVAIRAGVKIVPIVSLGGHESLYLFSDGRAIARALRLPQLVRSNVFPIGLALPYGVVLGYPAPHIPLPVKVHTRILAPIDLGFPPSAADDPDALHEGYRQVVAAMESAVVSMRTEGRHGIWPKH